MTPERWQQVEEVLQATLDRPPHERAAFLIEACEGDGELQQEATSLIGAYDEARDFLEQPAIAQDARVLLGDVPQSNIGRAIGPYQIRECLGGGGMGEVYLAHDERLDRLVALKILPAYFASDDARLHRFQREARAASALNHPNILTIYEVGETEEVRFIATELIDGQTIRELIEAESLSLKEVLDIAIQVAFGLSAAHAAGIVHRDIKPENIMRRRDGIVKILDFGIAKLLEPTLSDSLPAARTAFKAQTEIGVVLGTVGYMSPEQARGLQVDERTDIWSLGVLLYEMLSRRAPFVGATRMDTIVAILEREPAPIFHLIDGASPVLSSLQQIVSRALHKEMSERYQTSAEVLADLKQIRQQLETAGDLAAQIAVASIESKAFHNETLSAAEKQASLVLPATGRVNYHYRYRLLMLTIALLVTTVTGALLYRHWRLKEKPDVFANKVYTQMTDAEQLAFIDQREQRISEMMGDRPVKLNDEALRAIKRQLDRYVARENSASQVPGKERLREIYSRAHPYIPLIARAFAARKIPLVVGIYLPMIESEYKPCFENEFGAKGLFQFLPQTAKNYGVANADMCDVEKMAPAAAHYIADRMAELGDDSESMTLVLLSYNTGAEWVRDTLRQLRDTDKYERNFWTLFANRDKLNDAFRREGAGYVPGFFASAIIGENPQNFDLQMPALSSLAHDGATAKQ